jgi:hypothetical protein
MPREGFLPKIIQTEETQLSTGRQNIPSSWDNLSRPFFQTLRFSRVTLQSLLDTMVFALSEMRVCEFDTRSKPTVRQRTFPFQY